MKRLKIDICYLKSSGSHESEVTDIDTGKVLLSGEFNLSAFAEFFVHTLPKEYGPDTSVEIEDYILDDRGKTRILSHRSLSLGEFLAEE